MFIHFSYEPTVLFFLNKQFLEADKLIAQSWFPLLTTRLWIIKRFFLIFNFRFWKNGLLLSHIRIKWDQPFRLNRYYNGSFGHEIKFNEGRVIQNRSMDLFPFALIELSNHRFFCFSCKLYPAGKTDWPMHKSVPSKKGSIFFFFLHIKTETLDQIVIDWGSKVPAFQMNDRVLSSYVLYRSEIIKWFFDLTWGGESKKKKSDSCISFYYNCVAHLYSQFIYNANVM